MTLHDIDPVKLTSNILDNDFLAFESSFRDYTTDIPRVEIAPKPETLDSVRLSSFFQYWEGLPRGRRLPLSEAIDAVEIGPALGIVMLLETTEDPYDFRYRVYGSEIVAITRTEMTGKTTSDIPMPDLRALFQATYAAAVRLACPVLSHHRAPPEFGMTLWARLILPCEDGSGRINRLLAASEPAMPTLVGRTPWPYA